MSLVTSLFETLSVFNAWILTLVLLICHLQIVKVFMVNAWHEATARAHLGFLNNDLMLLLNSLCLHVLLLADDST